MIRLTGFELGKIWGRRSFLVSLLVLLSLNLFLAWFSGLPDESSYSLSSYRTFQEEIEGMTEAEKASLVTGMKETMEGVCLVQEVLMVRRGGGEMGEELARQTMESRPGVFEQYYGLYQSGGYLKLTDSFEREERLTEELFGQWQKVAGYSDYLESVRETRSTLGSISVFGGGKKDSFSSRNILKSASDYAGLTAEGISWMPDLAVVRSLENSWTDLFLLLSVFLFSGYLILEEKGKGLFFITRGTKHGIVRSILCKLTALLIHCMVMAFLLYGANFAFFGSAAGLGDLDAPLQSLASCTESSLRISILQYILLSIITRGLVMFGFGSLLTAFCIRAEHLYAPYAGGILLWGVSFLLYTAVPAASRGSIFKYLNLAGLMRTELLYGAYLNFDLLGYPISRTASSWMFFLLLMAAGVGGSVFLFARGTHLGLKDGRNRSLFSFRPHACLLRHEAYRILVAGHALLPLILFAGFTGFRAWNHSYNPSVGEQYYQDIMCRLEGELTEEKERLILSEQARYQEAFDQIALIDERAAAGEIGETAAENLKSRWYAVTAFYPFFSRALQQYERIRETGGCFVYDTGYLYLLGRRADVFRIDLLLLSLGVVLAFGNITAMEERTASWNLLGTTLGGKKALLGNRVGLCMAGGAALALVPFIARAAAVGRVFHLGGFAFSIQDIPCCGNVPVSMPIWCFLGLMVLSQALTLALAALAVALISLWQKNTVRTCFAAVLLLVVPPLLDMMGFSFAGKFSLYPLYAWTAML